MDIDWIPIGSSRIIQAKERGNRGLFPSSKVPNGVVEYESCLERDFFLICHHAPDVIKFQHQPVSILYEDKNQKSRTYTPDAFVEFVGGKKGLFEIKYEEEVLENGEKYKERWNAAEEWAKKRNMVFSVVTELKIRTPRWFNIWFTLGSSKCRLIDAYIREFIQLIPEEGERYNDLCFLLSESLGIEINKAAQILCHCIYHGLVFLDTFSTKQLSSNSIIRKRRKHDFPSFSSLWELFGVKTTPCSQIVDELVENDNLLTNITFKIPKQYEKIVSNRIKIVESWLNQPKQKRSHKWRHEFCKKWDVSEKTVYNWVNAYRTDGCAGLIPKHGNAGRPRLFNEKRMELMENGRQIFLKPLTSQKKAYTDLKDLCNAQKVVAPTFSSFKRYVYKNTTASEFARKRGKKYHKATFTPSLASFQGAFAPMQVVQMDNTNLDLFPVDAEERLGLSTPCMTAAIDCYTRMITGFSVSYFPSSSRTILDVLTQTILPKDAYTRAYGTQQDWFINGFPVLLLVDNGMDYRSQALKEFCMKYDIIIEFAPIRTPRYKAFIEQWFNIIHNALANEDVSGFRPLLKQRIENPELKPEADAVLTLQEIEQWLHQWILDEYHFTNPYEDHAPAPYLRWQDYQDGQTNIVLPLPREPPTNQQEIDLLYLSSLERFERTLRRDGIAWHHLKYNNKVLGTIYNKVGNQAVDVLLNPRDIRCVWVINPLNSSPVKVDLGSGWAQAIAKIHGDRPIHESAWKMDLKLITLRLKSRISPFLYQKEMSRIKRETLLKNAKLTTKTTRKEKEKVKETERNSISSKIQPDTSPPVPINESPKVFEIPRPKSIVIPPRSTNPFAGITKKKAEEMMKRKKEAR